MPCFTAMRAEIALMSGSAFAVTHHAFSSGAGRTSDGNGSHASTLKSPSYTKSVSWQHYLRLIPYNWTITLEVNYTFYEISGINYSHGKYIMYKSLFTIIILLYSASSYAKSESPPASTITFIAQIDHVELNKTALSHDMILVLADRFYFKTSNPCETNSISARPESMDITDKAYADKLKN
ncbi:putative transposase [Shigella flexneri 2747-71]|nr:putative transposase [Shigella flexneri 2747-71]